MILGDLEGAGIFNPPPLKLHPRAPNLRVKLLHSIFQNSSKCTKKGGECSFFIFYSHQYVAEYSFRLRRNFGKRKNWYIDIDILQFIVS